LEIPPVLTGGGGSSDEKIPNEEPSIPSEFDVGKVVGACRKVIAILTGLGGAFNQGIFLAEDEHDKLNDRKAIMKILILYGLMPRANRREISALSKLSHPDIIELYWVF
jgi:hypothetical protein